MLYIIPYCFLFLKAVSVGRGNIIGQDVLDTKGLTGDKGNMTDLWYRTSNSQATVFQDMYFFRCKYIHNKILKKNLHSVFDSGYFLYH